jgi:3-phosphoshikimate 1-carboxyvinyltransferase
MLSAMASGTSTITGMNDGDDVRRTADAISALGARVAGHERSAVVEVEGWGESGPGEAAGVIDAGNSGTTARILLGIMAAGRGTSVVSGDESLSRRPMLRVVAPLRAMGATIDGRAHGDRLPLSVRGGSLNGMDHVLPVASAQVKSALLLAGMHAAGATSVTEPLRSRDHTENMLRASGVEVDVDRYNVTIRGGQRPQPSQWAIPGDVSSALFFVAAASIVEGSDLTLERVGLNPTRTGALQVLRMMGADISIESAGLASGEPTGDIRVRHSELVGCHVGAGLIPSCVDEIPVLAVAAATATGETVFEGVGELRVKESDRLTAIVDGLNHLGGEAAISGDNLVIRGPRSLEGGTVDSQGDHRMAMAFAVAGLVSSATIRVQRWSSVDTSFPGFLDVLGQAQGGVR